MERALRPPGPAFDLSAALTTEIRAAQAALATSLSVKAVHHCRVQLKRARALARLGRVGAPGLAAVFDDSARATMHLLAPAREHAALAAVARRAAKSAPEKAATALNAAADRLDYAPAPAPAAALEAALKDLHALAQVWPEASARQITRGAEEIVRRARRARRRGLENDDMALRHKWRRREKERLYAAEALGADWPRRRLRKRAARLVDTLGKEHDTLLLIERLCGAPLIANDEAVPKSALKALRRQAKRLRQRADTLGRKLRDARV